MEDVKQAYAKLGLPKTLQKKRLRNAIASCFADPGRRPQVMGRQRQMNSAK